MRVPELSFKHAVCGFKDGMFSQPSLRGTKWVQRPPGGDDDGCYSLAEYTFEEDGTCVWELEGEDLSSQRGEGSWSVAAGPGGVELLVADLTSVRSREGDDEESEWENAKPQRWEVSLEIFTKLYERQHDGATKPETEAVATTLMRLYTALLASVDVPLAPADEAGKISYNVLLTPAYFMVVPRSSENFGDYGINSVGFAGSVLVRTEEQAKSLASLGPMNLLQNVGCPKK